MSVINQMLQDLEHRRSRAAGDASLSGLVRAVPKRSRTHPVWLALGFMLAVGVGFSAWLFLRPDAMLVVTPATASAPEVRATANAGVTQVESSRSIASAAPTSTSASITTPTPTPAAAVMTVAPVESASPLAAMPPSNSEPATRSARQADLPDDDAVAAVSQDKLQSNPLPKEITAQQRNENEYGKAVALVQAGQTSEAIKSLDSVLQINPGHAAARQTLVGVLVSSKQYAEAERRLQDGLRLDPAQTGLAMVLARLQVERGDARAGLQTLQYSLPHAAGRADYLAFLAALLQREGRHKEAIEYYLQALRGEPNSGVWLMGVGISLQAENRHDEARDALRRALASNTLGPGLQAYVEQLIRQSSP